MNIVLTALMFPHPVGGNWPGYERFVYEISSVLAKKGNEVNVLTTTEYSPIKCEEIKPGLIIHRDNFFRSIPGIPTTSGYFSLKVQKTFREQLMDADAVLTHPLSYFSIQPLDIPVLSHHYHYEPLMLSTDNFLKKNPPSY